MFILFTLSCFFVGLFYNYSFYFYVIFLLFMLFLLFVSSFFTLSFSSFLFTINDELSLFMIFMLLLVMFVSVFYKPASVFLSPFSFFLLFFIIIACILTFSSSSLLFLYIGYELSLIPIIFIIIVWGSYPERSLSSLMLLLYTSLFTIPFLYVL